MANVESEPNCLTKFHWQIRNFSYWKSIIYGDSISSLPFDLAGTSMKTVRLKFFPKGLCEENKQLQVQIESCHWSPSAPVPVNCKAYLLYGLNKVPFAHRGMITGNQEIKDNEPLLLPPGPTYELLHKERSFFLPQDVLTLQCHIWRLDEVKKLRFFHSAVSTIEYRETHCIWPMNYFRTLERNKEIIIPLSLNLSPEKAANITLELTIPEPLFPGCKIALKLADCNSMISEAFLSKIIINFFNQRMEALKFLKVECAVRMPFVSNQILILNDCLAGEDILDNENYALSLHFLVCLPNISQHIDKFIKYFEHI